MIFNSNKLITGSIIFILNLMGTSTYFYYLIGNLNSYELWEEATLKGVTTTYFLFDVLQYQLYPNTHSLVDIISILSSGSTMIHSAVLQMIFGGGESLGTSILINSLFISITFSQVKWSRIKSIYIFIILSPYFIFYSIGWTKEILLTLAMIIFIQNVEIKFNMKLMLSYFITLVTRPQFIALLFLVNIIKKIRDRYINICIFIILSTSPYWLSLVPEAYYNAANVFYEQRGGQGYSMYTDYLKNNIPVLSIVGYLFSFAKIYYEPLSGIIHEYNYYALVELYLEIILLYIVFMAFKKKKSIFPNKSSKLIFIVVNIFVCSLPFTHFRYLLPIIVPIIIINYSAIIRSN